MRTRSHGMLGCVLETVASACEDDAHHMLSIEYHKEGTTGTEPRTVEPYFIRSDGDHSLLEAFDCGRQAWRTFRIDRIKSARALADTFIPREHTERTEAGLATLVFANDTLPDDWPGLKKQRTLPDGRTEARIPWYGGLWLPKKIIAHADTIQAMSPPELVEAVASYARARVSARQVEM